MQRVAAKLATSKIKHNSVVSSSEEDSESEPDYARDESESSDSSDSDDNVPLKQQILDKAEEDVGVADSSDEGGHASGGGPRSFTTVITEPSFKELSKRDTIVQYFGHDDSQFERRNVWLAVITDVIRKGKQKGVIQVNYLLPVVEGDLDGEWSVSKNVDDQGLFVKYEEVGAKINWFDAQKCVLTSQVWDKLQDYWST